MIDIVNEDREEFAPMTKKAVEVAATASKRERADDGLTYAIRLEFDFIYQGQKTFYSVS